MSWQTIVVLTEAVFFVPLYFVIFVAVLRGRKTLSIFQNHYYTLVISQAIVDFFALFFVISIMLPRYFGIGNSLIYSTFPVQIAILVCNSGGFFFVIRLFGVFLITVQRFVTICYPNSTCTIKLKSFNAISIISFHWIVPIIAFAPAAAIKDTYFDNIERLFIITSEENIRAFSIVIISSFAILFPIILFMYIRILLVICSKNNNVFTNRAKYQEHRLSFHIFLLALISSAIFCYQICEVSFAKSIPTETIMFIRRFHPLLSAHFSFINPLILILVNKDIQLSIKTFFGWKTESKFVSDINQRAIQMTVRVDI